MLSGVGRGCPCAVTLWQLMLEMCLREQAWPALSASLGEGRSEKSFQIIPPPFSTTLLFVTVLLFCTVCKFLDDGGSSDPFPSPVLV